MSKLNYLNCLFSRFLATCDSSFCEVNLALRDAPKLPQDIEIADQIAIFHYISPAYNPFQRSDKIQQAWINSANIAHGIPWLMWK